MLFKSSESHQSHHRGSMNSTEVYRLCGDLSPSLTQNFAGADGIYSGKLICSYKGATIRSDPPLRVPSSNTWIPSSLEVVVEVWAVLSSIPGDVVG